MTRKEALKEIKTKRVNVPIFSLTAYVHFAETSSPISAAYGFERTDFAGVVWVDEDSDIHVAFSIEEMDIPTIAHEAVHMASKVFLHVGYTPYPDNDEMQAYLVTYFVDEILNAQQKLNVGKMKNQG